MKYNGIALFADLDGTLLDDNRQLSDENLAAVKYFVDNGGSFAVATGRMERSTLINFPDLTINTPSIFYNGALIFDTQRREQLHHIYMPEGLEPVFQYILDNFPSCGVEVNAKGEAYVIRYNDIINFQLKREGFKGIKSSWNDVPRGWFKLLIADKRPRLIEIKEYLINLKRTDISVTFSEEELVDVMASNVSKGAALERLMQANADKWRTVFAIGDNDNDLDMIRTADVGIAVDNASEKVKEAAKYIVEHHNIPCIPQVLNLIEEYL